MKITLIRHGKTLANEKHLYCGSTDLPLSEAGKAQLRQLRYDCGDVRYLSSGMKRTDESLQLLFGEAAYAVDHRFREVDFGSFEMKGYQELCRDPAYIVWISGDNEANVPPGGESGVQMRKRVMEAFREITEDTVLVCHGGVIAAIMQQLFPGEGKNRYEWQPENGGGYILELGENGQNRWLPLEPWGR